MAFKNAIHLAFEPTMVRLEYCSPKRAMLGCMCILLTNKFAFVLGFSKWLNNLTLPSLKRTAFAGELLEARLADLVSDNGVSDGVFVEVFIVLLVLLFGVVK